MALIDDVLTGLTTLDAALVSLNADVDAALAMIVPGATDAQLQQAKDMITTAMSSVSGEVAKIKAVVPTAP